MLIHAFRLKARLHLLPVLLLLFTVFGTELSLSFKPDSNYSLLLMAATHALLLSQLSGRNGLIELLLLCSCLIVSIFVPLQISLLILGLLSMIYTVVQLLNKQVWLHGLMLLILVLGLMLFPATNWFVIAVGLWLVLQAKQLQQQLTVNHQTYDDSYFAEIQTAKAAERSRIYQNIHDDVGAELLKLIYQLEDSQQQSQVKSIMNKLRQAVASTAHINITAEQLIREIADEAKLRCTAAGIEFSYEVDVQANPGLDQVKPVHLQRIIRELVSNCLKHAQAKRLELRAQIGENSLVMTLLDDGVGMNKRAAQGKGIRSLTKRVEASNGTIGWQNHKPNGTQVDLKLEL